MNPENIIKILRKLQASLLQFQRKYQTLLASFLLVGGILRVEIVQHNASQQIKSLQRQLIECHAAIGDYEKLSQSVKIYEHKLSQMELELDMYRTALIMRHTNRLDSLLTEAYWEEGCE